MLVNLHTAVIGQRKPVSLALDRGGAAGGDARRGAPHDAAGLVRRRLARHAGLLRERLPVDARFDGPAIIEQLDCTTVIEPGNRVWMDAIGNLIVTV